MPGTRLTALVFISLLIAQPIGAAQAPRPQAAGPQTAAPQAADPVRREAADVAGVWTLLSEGQLDRAAQRSQQLLVMYPRSAAVLAAAVAAAGMKGGAAAGLAVYDHWIGSRTFEEPLVLRSLALVVLREAAKQEEDPIARGEAVGALIREGERASGQDDPVVTALIGDLRDGSSSARAMNQVEALGAAGTPRALQAILASADDPRMEIRGAAADALGRFRSDEARARLTQLLSDRALWVRAHAAGALLELGDESGLGVLQTLAAETEPSLRLLAATELATRPDAAWQALVRGLADGGNPEISANAAVLLAPHDPARARAILDGLKSNENPAIVELAQINSGTIAVESSNLTELRAALHAATPRARTKAAVRVVDLLR